MKGKNLVYFILGILVLGGLFFTLKPKRPQESISDNPVPNSSSEASPSATTQEKIFELVIENKKLVTGPETIQVTKGDAVIIKITSDEEEEFHIHGYDKSVDLAANEPTELKFTANLTGRFPYELEDSKTEIGAIEVQPK